MAPRRRRVLIDLTSGWQSVRPGGISRFVSELAHGLVEAHDDWRDDLDLVGVVDLPELFEAKVTRDLDAAVEQGRRDAQRFEPRDLAARRRFSLTPALFRDPPDLLHLPDPAGTPLSRVPRVVTCHQLFPYAGGSEPSSDRARRALAMRRYRTARRVAVVSEATRRDLEGLGASPGDRVELIPCGIDLVRFSADPHPLDERRLRRLSADRPFVLFVGRSDARKNAEAMIQALAVARRTQDLTLIGAGFIDDRVRGRLATLAQTSGVADHVRWVDEVTDDELATLYRHAVALLAVSRREGFGLPVVEAMAAGCPALVTRGSPMHDNGGDAVLPFEPEDAAGMGAALAALVADPERRARLSRAGRERAARFSRERVAREYTAFYRRALGL
jgi:glycosyltransferase involved in cell wall biosynthesis